MAQPSPAPPARSNATTRERVLIVDGRNMLPLWLEEKVARRELTPAEADKMLAEQEDRGKLWLGPAKDAVGNTTILARLARDFASWKGARVSFARSAAGHDLIIFKDWPDGRKLVSGTRYRTDNPKMIELQIGKPELWAAARESARFGVILVVAIDVADCLIRRKSLGTLLGHLTVDIPSVYLASAAGAAAGAYAVSAAAAGGTSLIAMAGGLALGPIAVAVGAGVLLYEADEYFHLSEKLGRLYDHCLAALARAWHELGAEAARCRQLASSHLVRDLRQYTGRPAARIGREADLVRAGLAQLAW